MINRQINTYTIIYQSNKYLAMEVQRLFGVTCHWK